MSSGELASTRPLATARIVSSLPGRLRLRLDVGGVNRKRLDAALEVLSENPAVLTVSARWQTSSLLIGYSVSEGDAVWSMLAQLGLDPAARHVAHAQLSAEPSERVTRTLVAANAVVRRRAGGNDLRTLVPLGFGLLALRQFVRDDQRLVDAPWYILPWYASETFQKFHQPAKGDQDR